MNHVGAAAGSVGEEEAGQEEGGEEEEARRGGVHGEGRKREGGRGVFELFC